MGFVKGQPRPANAGRKPGSPNKSTADIKALAFKYCPDAIIGLAKLAQDPSPTIRMAAYRELLDRGIGRAAQPQTGEGGEGPVQIKHIISWQK